MLHHLKKIIQFIICLWVLSSCSGIIIDKGPFPISANQQRLQAKKDYLANFEPSAHAGNRPNIVLIIVDDLGKHDLQLYHPEGVNTPHIQSLAKEGVLFLNAYSSSAVCSPSRAGIFTGRYQQRYGFERQPMNQYARNKMEYFIFDHLINTDPMRLVSPMSKVTRSEIEKQGIPEEEILISEVLQSRGYTTALCGKWHLGHQAPFKPNERGFDMQYGFYEAFSLYSPARSEGIIDFRHDYFANKHIWRQKRKETCAIRVNDTIIIEEEYLTFSIANRSIEFMKTNRNTPFFLVTAFNAPHTPFQVPVEYYNKFPDIENKNRRVYMGMIAALDDAVGRVTNAIDSLGLKENTLIIFASDNGGATYTGATDNGNLKAGKFSQFEGGVNIPMILSWGERFKEKTTYNEPVCLIDLFPTMMSASGIEMPEDRRFDGVNLLPYIEGQKEHPHEYLFWRTDYNRTVRTDKWKLIWNSRDDQLFLYQLDSDPWEQKNLADAYPEIVERLKEKIMKWDSEMMDPLWPGVMEFRFDIDGEVTWWAI